ncbi:hypothetical protein AVEN_69281-1 [Araneus ventricosus]|uniref:Uncharacterized protein n=1 Tax=Araneus ventricosus TaxID=182803 RepID=A0A4Y2K5Y2_ARAVE|nr:hypothetical protein AVEN_69281-1 [Araneus ventricosus]
MQNRLRRKDHHQLRIIIIRHHQIDKIKRYSLCTMKKLNEKTNNLEFLSSLRDPIEQLHGISGKIPNRHRFDNSEFWSVGHKAKLFVCPVITSSLKCELIADNEA